MIKDIQFSPLKSKLYFLIDTILYKERENSF